jgi:hypothetical protein
MVKIQQKIKFQFTKAKKDATIPQAYKDFFEFFIS